MLHSANSICRSRISSTRRWPRASRIYGDKGGSSFDPKLSLLWQVLDQLAFRDSVGTTFRAPPQASLVPEEAIAFQAILGSNRPVGSVGNLDLELEEAFTFSVGSMINVGNFRATVDFWPLQHRDAETPESPAIGIEYSGSPLEVVCGVPMEPAFPFAVELPVRGEGALRKALHHQIRSAILDGRLTAGTPLPATRRVAAEFDIARNTVVAAYDLLIAEGYVLPRRRARAVVAQLAAQHPTKKSRSARTRRDIRANELWRTPGLRSSSREGLPERSFRLGVPDARCFPHDVWRRLSARVLRAFSRASFNYPPSEGLPELREAIAQHAAFARAVACTAEDVIVTSGAQQAFDLIARLLVIPNQTVVAVEEPGYPPARAAFIAAGARLALTPVDEEGLRVERLPTDARIVSVTPSHQSPTGATLSLRRRAALLHFARQYGAAVVEDDYDGEFRFGGRPLDALQMQDRDALVFYVGTFSKSVFPALRKGFIVAPRWAREDLITIKQCVDSHCDALTQSTLAAFIREGHLARHVRRMRGIYAQRRAALLGGLERELAPWFEPIPSAAGLHVAAHIRKSALAPAIFQNVRSCMPGAQPTSEYALGRLDRPAVAFGYGTIDAKDIPPAVTRLRRALANLK